MKFSIVTPSLNQGEYIEQTIRSVLAQSGVDVEHIVVDGGSTDGTLGILRRYPHLRWISERDGGQSDAINKGFRMATGGVLAWLNSDDYYAEGALRSVADVFEADPACALIHGDLTYVDREGSVLETLTGPSLTHEALLRSPDIVRQPSTFWRRELFDDAGPLDERLHLIMDYDFLLRATARHSPRHIPRVLAFFRSYAEGKTQALRRRQVREFYRVFRKHGIPLTPARWRFMVGRYVDSFGPRHPLRVCLAPLRNRPAR